ncbi:MAG: hypothetical protein B6D34_10305 [Candidatus Brocadia sp. UTAMX1]|jgi:hypothetical protein|nr:MAG: hypothetical protein B6D34_10305 [Candidatus Brocadia sp. UTAMX1]
MNEIQATIFSGIVGAILGGVIGVVGTYFGAVKISDRERKIKLFNDTAETLRIALIKTIQRLDIQKGAFTIIKEDFLIHDELRRRFELCLDDAAIDGFNKVWDKYKYWHDNIANQNVGEIFYPEMNPKKDDPVFQTAKKTDPKDIINELINLARYK